MADAKTTLNALAERYCEGWCKDNGGRGSFKDCTGCDIAAAAPQPAASDVPHDVVEQAARASYEYEGDRKGIDYAGWDIEPENIKRQWRESVSVPLAVASADNARLRAALRNNFCPRPCNHRPAQFEVGGCVDAGECGCMNVTALYR